VVTGGGLDAAATAMGVTKDELRTARDGETLAQVALEQADARKADATQRATDMVNGVRPSGPPADAPAADTGN